MGRRRFQFHLGTAVAMMIAMGTIMWANIRRREAFDWHDGPDGRTFNLACNHYGWPLDNAQQLVDVRNDLYLRYPESQFPMKFFPGHIVLNLFWAATLLFLVWFMCEWWMRRSLEVINSPTLPAARPDAQRHRKSRESENSTAKSGMENFKASGSSAASFVISLVCRPHLSFQASNFRTAQSRSVPDQFSRVPSSAKRTIVSAAMLTHSVTMLRASE